MTWATDLDVQRCYSLQRGNREERLREGPEFEALHPVNSGEDVKWAAVCIHLELKVLLQTQAWKVDMGWY